MDSSAATAALAAVAVAGMWQGCALFCAAGDPVPYYDDPKLSPKELLADLRRMLIPAMKLQSCLVVLGTVASALTAWGLRSSNSKAAASFSATAAANVFIFAFTMNKIMPVNRRLLPEGDAEKLNDEGLRGLLKQWGELHGVRTIAGAAALGAALFGVHCCLAK